MSSIWIDAKHMTIRSYGASAKGSRAIVKVEIEVTEPAALGFLLKDIGDTKNEIDRARSAEAEAQRQEKKRPAVAPQKRLMLPYFGGERS